MQTRLMNQMQFQNYQKAMAVKDIYGKNFKFNIPNFQKFKMADDPAIVVIEKGKDGKIFYEELPVKWGVISYNHWESP